MGVIGDHADLRIYADPGTVGLLTGLSWPCFPACRGGDLGAWRRGLVFYEGAGTAPVAGVAGGGDTGSRLVVRVRLMLAVSGAHR